ncbi:hypothetical protein GGR54DRAFT_583184 [Hypoxylon sp. NC1633]|nr:hypothetical protein GGR54DRAFT_583184 [Hypoxylon sp. NC1633]
MTQDTSQRSSFLHPKGASSSGYHQGPANNTTTTTNDVEYSVFLRPEATSSSGRHQSPINHEYSAEEDPTPGFSFTSADTINYMHQMYAMSGVVGLPILAPPPVQVSNQSVNERNNREWMDVLFYLYEDLTSDMPTENEIKQYISDPVGERPNTAGNEGPDSDSADDSVNIIGLSTIAEHQRWAYHKAQMKELGFSDSPFLPKTFQEHVKLKELKITGKNPNGSPKVPGAGSSVAGTSHADGHGGMLPMVKVNEKLVRISLTDNLSLVNIRPTIWSKDCLENGTVDWSTSREYQQSAGNLPLPRVQQLDERFSHLPYPREGPGIPRQYCKIADWALYPVLDMVTTEEVEDLMKPAPEMALEHVNGITGGFIEELDRI